jgi:hypothetical protein
VKSLINPYDGELGEIAELLLEVETFHHERGWDNSATTLYTVTRSAGVCRYLLDYDVNATSTAPVAHLLVTEAWMHTFTGRAQWNAETRRYADIPGSQECRFAAAVVGEDTIRLRRIRGCAPEFVAEEELLGEALMTSLRSIHQATVTLYRLPAPLAGL